MCVVVVALAGVSRRLAERVVASANAALTSAGAPIEGPHEMDVALPPLSDDRAITLIRAIASLRPTRRILALSAQSLRGPRGRPVVGEAQLKGRIAVVSTSTYAQDAERVAEQALHEIGHLWGLRHCGALGCVMNRRACIGSTGGCSGFCARCVSALGATSSEG